jgi:hypothetical protein
MSRIVEAVLGYRRCDCKCNKVQQPVIIKNNIFGQQSQQPSGGGGGSSVGVGAPSGAGISQTQVWNLTPDQYSWTIAPMPNPYTPGNSILVVNPAYMGLSAPGFKYQLNNASTVTVTITANNRFISFSDIVSEPNPSSTYMQSATMSSSVSGGTSTLTAETSTFDTSILNNNSIDFLVYNDQGYLSMISPIITSVTITITYNAGGGFNNNSA